ncbi:MAG: site-specific integrase [Novosphingobium sp.]|uniref:tyrosine-type recombinase/integrase n=1 Tax=Novosphingobium sp. TaxID=1874826 RepID=UPI0032BB68A1
MTKHSAANERIKREYFGYLVQARGRDEATIDGVAKSLARFEESTRGKDFKRFHREQAVAFKTRLGEAVNGRTGERLSKATILSTLRDLKAFFFWLAHLPGFKSHIRYDDCDYFSLSDKDVAIARATRDKPVPTLEQVHRVLSTMPAATVLERRDRALIAFTAITGARANALASFRLGHVDLEAGKVVHDARTVRTKFAKTFLTYFMSVGGGALEIVQDWIGELTREHLWGPADPLFPATEMGLDENGGFIGKGLSRQGWGTSNPVRDIFKRAFEAAGLPYYNPHSFRAMLVRHAMSLDLSQQQMKAWSQNLGHADVLTTFTSYGTIPAHLQGELIRSVGEVQTGDDWTKDADVQAMLKALAAKAQRSRRG